MTAMQDDYYRAHILYIEDDLGLGRLLKKRLERLACKVETAENGQKGLALAVGGTYDIVITDYHMPGMNGMDVLRELRGNTPVVILTGQGDERIAVEAMKLGAADYVSKDVGGEFIEILPSVIDRVMEREQLKSERKQALSALEASEARYRAIVEDQTELICRIYPDGKLVYANSTFCRYFRIPLAEVAFHSLSTILPRSAALELKELLKRVTPQNPVATYSHSFANFNHPLPWLHWTVRGIFQGVSVLHEFQMVGRDVTELKCVEDALREIEKKNSILLNAIPDLIFRLDSQGTCLDVRPKKGQALAITPDSIGKKLNELVPPTISELLMEKLNKAFQEQSTQVVQFELQTEDCFSYQEARITFAGENEALVIVRDITERARLEKQLQYLNIHDSLTGVYNRAYFQEEMHRLANTRYKTVGIVVCDVDALKVINDNLGHVYGDQLLRAAAEAIRKAFRNNDAVSRIGGDEFAVLLPGADWTAVEEACNRLRQETDQYNAAKQGLFLSISVGAAVCDNPLADLGQAFQQADESMYGDKLRRSRGVREAVVEQLRERLNQKGLHIQEHACRVKALMGQFGKMLGFQSDRAADLELFAEYHDIGKIVLPERILASRERITSEDIAVIKRHCEAGQKIALTVPKLFPVADWILKHHEWWNGAGYPLGIKGQEIPFECRMLSICDAYESMTSGRYLIKRTMEEALEELKSFAGTQFDPELVETFVQVMQSEDAAEDMQQCS